jgi:hypothetical protein
LRGSEAIRAARPDVWLGVDGNQGFVVEQLDELIAVLVEEDVACSNSRSPAAAKPISTAISRRCRSPVTRAC